eukprot:COSAG01_NODE_6063_length_3874_cov_5.778278_1_plen_55_part_10
MRRHCCGYEIELRYPGFMEEEVSRYTHSQRSLLVKGPQALSLRNAGLAAGSQPTA